MTTQLTNFMPPDDMDDVMEIMQPMYVKILQAIQSSLPDHISAEHAVSAAMAALAKATASVIDDAFGLEQAEDVIRKYSGAILECIKVYNQEIEGVE